MPAPRWPRAVRWAGAGASKPGGAHRRAPTVVATRRRDGRTRRLEWDCARLVLTVDADGVALAAIQGLNAKLEEREATLHKEIRAKDAEISALQGEVTELRLFHERELAELRHLVEMLMARTSSEGRVAQAH